MSAFTESVVKNCLAEWNRFDQGTGAETGDPFFKFVGEYWKIGVNNPNLDGRTTITDHNGHSSRPPWSAAFISYIMRQSGAGDAFLYHEGHIHYVVKALRDAADPNSSAKFFGRDPRSYVPKRGDIINAGRAGSAGVTFVDVLEKYGNDPVPRGDFVSSHSDIAVEIDPARRELTTIGGNVAVNTVGKKTWEIDDRGVLVKGPSLICVIECLL